MVCSPLDVACQFQESIVAFIVPFILVIVLFLIAIFVLPKAGWRGVVLSLTLIFFILWWYGLIPGLPALKGLLLG